MKFLDSVLDTITDTGKGVVQKAKDVTEVTKIAGQISVEENEIRMAYLSIGKKYVEAHQGEISEAYEEDFKRIEDAQMKIIELKERQNEIKGINECPSCGGGVALDASFCSNCGAKLEKKVVVVTDPCDVDSAEAVKEEIVVDINSTTSQVSSDDQDECTVKEDHDDGKDS